MVVVIDYDMGNIGSVLNMLDKIGIKAKVSSGLTDIENADKLVLPGVGTFDRGIENITSMNLLPTLNKKILVEKIPILGICLGMQLMTAKSEEGRMPGLGWLDAETVRFKFNNITNNMKIPHMEWNSITIKRNNKLLEGIGEDNRFYFVHSYHIVCNKDQDIIATTLYSYDFISVINKDNIFGVQFHPEKSHRFGMKILENFAKL